MSSSNQTDQARKQLYEQGMSIRKEVLGDTHVSKSLANATPFTSAMQEYATEIGWGYIWARPGLDRKQRSLINVAMLCALGKSQELGVHVKGAVRNGLSEVEIREALLQAAGYAGFPAGMEGFRVADQVVTEMEKNGELPDGFRSESNTVPAGTTGRSADAAQGGIKTKEAGDAKPELIPGEGYAT